MLDVIHGGVNLGPVCTRCHRVFSASFILPWLQGLCSHCRIVLPNRQNNDCSSRRTREGPSLDPLVWGKSEEMKKSDEKQPQNRFWEIAPTAFSVGLTWKS